MADMLDPRYELEGNDLLSELRASFFSRETIRVAWILLTLFLAGGWLGEYVGRSLRDIRFEQADQVVLHKDGPSEICSVMYRKPGIMTRPFFIVWSRASEAEAWNPLFTVEPSGDSPAGPPILKETPEGPQITDEDDSYVYDVACRKIITNKSNDQVYTGTFRNCLDPPR